MPLFTDPPASYPDGWAPAPVVAAIQRMRYEEANGLTGYHAATLAGMSAADDEYEGAEDGDR